MGKPISVIPLASPFVRKRLALYHEYMAEEVQTPISLLGGYSMERSVFYDEIESVYVYRKTDWWVFSHILLIVLFGIAAALHSAWWLLGAVIPAIYVLREIFLPRRMARVMTAQGVWVEFQVDRPIVGGTRRFFPLMLALIHRATGTPWKGPVPKGLPEECRPAMEAAAEEGQQQPSVPGVP